MANLAASRPAPIPLGHTSPRSSWGHSQRAPSAPPGTPVSFFQTSTQAQPAAPRFGGTAVHANTPPLSETRDGSPGSSLLFLGASSFPGRQGYIAQEHPIFYEAGAPLELMLATSPSPVGPYTPAQPMVVILPGMSPLFTSTMPLRGACTGHASSQAGQRFERGTQNHRSSDFTVLYDVQADCGFFSTQVYDAIRNGSLAASEGLPSASRMRDSFSVFAFLRFRPGSDISPFLPLEGWATLDDAQRFVASI